MAEAAPPGGRLTLGTLARVPAEHRSAIEPQDLSVGVVHLGVGAFHRAHQVDYIERAAEAGGDHRFGISAFSERSPVAAEVLAAQDGLYSLRLASPASSSIRVLASLREVSFVGEAKELLLRRLADPEITLVTLTVTEKGYRHDPASRRLLRDDPGIKADAAGRPPVTVLGQLVRGLEARFRAGGAPITVASCDNLPANGAVLGGLVAEMLELARCEAALQEWVAGNVAFPCSMVDRIVPAATPPDRAAAAAALGVADVAAVAAEPFAQWVVEDRFAARRPALEASGVQLVADVAPYETLKLRVLNGSHSALAYLGALAGVGHIAEAVALPPLAGLVRRMTDEEVAPTLELPPGVDFGAYRDEVLERFANPLLAHRCLQVASDGSHKLPQRLLETVRGRLAAGATAPIAVLVVAAYLRAVLHGKDDAGRPFEVSDPLAGELRRRVGPVEQPAEVAARTVRASELFGEDLAGDDRFVGGLAAALGDLASAPVLEVAAAYAAGSPPAGPVRASGRQLS